MKKVFVGLSVCVWAHLSLWAQQPVIVFQSDFGLKDAAVSEMKAVAFAQSQQLSMYDITHEIPPFNIAEAAFRLWQAVAYWPAGTVFVSVVDPGVGSGRKSVVLKTKTNHFIVSPDNGTLSIVARQLGIAGLREIDDELLSRGGKAGRSHTFHGRDVYAYTAAKLAAGQITFEQVGRPLPHRVIDVDIPDPRVSGQCVSGSIPVLDGRYGNVWTNIPAHFLSSIRAVNGDTLFVRFLHREQLVQQLDMPFVHTFSDVPLGFPLIYMNSLNGLSFGLNQSSFADVYHISNGPGWHVEVCKKDKN